MPALVLFLVYIALVVYVGVVLVEYICVALIGHTISVVIAAIIAFVTGFNFLVPAAFIIWLLQLAHVLH